MARRILLCTVACILFTASTAFSASIVFQASGPDAASITPVVDNFRAAVGGGPVAGANGSFGGVRREINWDGVPDSVAAPNNLPATFFNVNSPRGVVLGTPGTGFQVSADSSNPTSTPPLFGNLDPSYPATFRVFSPERLFTPLGSNVTDVTFFVPGTTTPASVSAFGVVFSDVDKPNVTSVEFFDFAGGSLGTGYVPAGPSGGLSFFGVLFNAGERIARVRIRTGEVAPAPGVPDNPAASNDVVVMDDFIYSEPAAPSVSIGDATVTEGGTASFTLTLNYAMPEPFPVYYGTADNTAQATIDNDYTAVPVGTLVTIPAYSTTATIDIATTPDAKLEPDETFFVNVTSAGASGTAVIADGQGLGTITNDDPIPQMSIADVSQNEGNSGTTPFAFVVTLSNPSSVAVQATWNTANGTALSGSDYAGAASNVIFSPGETTKTITINVTGDVMVEPNETFTMNLTAPVNATIADAQAVGTIVNDDAAVAAASVPTLSEWLLVALASLLVAAGIWKLR